MSQAPAAGPSPNWIKNHLKIRPQKRHRFSLKIEPQGTPKVHQNPKKSAQIHLGMPMEAPSQRARQKSGSWILPGRSQCRSSTVNTMLFVWSPRWLQTTFLLTLGLLRAPFLGPWAPKWHPGSEKGPSIKNIKKQPPKK